ncbi:MAG: hypothetical protein WBQ24_10310 [Xanthobacteraceae bacterium]
MFIEGFCGAQYFATLALMNIGTDDCCAHFICVFCSRRLLRGTMRFAPARMPRNDAERTVRQKGHTRADIAIRLNGSCWRNSTGNDRDRPQSTGTGRSQE